MSQPSPRKTQAELLSDALKETRTGRRALAVLLTGKPTPTVEEIESKKSQLTKWLTGRHGMSDESAERLWEAFEQIAPGRYDRDHFRKSQGGSMTWADQMRELASEAAARAVDSRVDEYQTQVRTLRDELATFRGEQTARDEEILRELRSLRNAS